MTTSNFHRFALLSALACLGLATSCSAEQAAGLAPSDPNADVMVNFDVFHKPLPDIPLPNDFATRHEPGSPTGLRINASLVAPTQFERTARRLFDTVDGWGVFAPITVSFDGPLDIQNIIDRHQGDDFDQSDDAVYVIDVTEGSPTFGQAAVLDLGNGNFPVVIEDLNGYGPNDPRGDTLSLLFEEHDEDRNGDGILQPEEDTDADGVLDKPNYLPGHDPAKTDLAGRADALMTFYERETDTLMLRPLLPLREQTTYAVVITKRLLDATGKPVGSPFGFVNHTSQTDKLDTLPSALTEQGLSIEDVAFTWCFTTQSVTHDIKRVRDGLYGLGDLAFIGEQFPAELSGMHEISRVSDVHVIHTEEWLPAYRRVMSELFGVAEGTEQSRILLEAQQFIDFHVFGKYKSPQLMRRFDEDGTFRPLNDQVWEFDEDGNPVELVEEEITFWLAVPRKETSRRGEGQPAQMAVLGHGYGSSKVEALVWAGHIARHGAAVLTMDHVSHGIPLDALQEAAARALLIESGGDLVADALFHDRATDQNGDTVRDSAPDFWSAYSFHTRDVLRQSALDIMQVLRVFASYDGQKQWTIPVGDGSASVTGVAGDFDGDGEVDVTGEGAMMVGGSLGGIMSSVVGGFEPKVDTIIPVSAIAGLGDGANRSLQGGVREATHLRLMGPMYLGDFTEEVSARGDTAPLTLSVFIPDLNSKARVELGTIDGVAVGDTIVARNLENEVTACGHVFDFGFRVALESDFDHRKGRIQREDGSFRWAKEEEFQSKLAERPGDRIQIEIYDGVALTGAEDCELRADATPKQVIEEFPQQIVFQTRPYAAGAPLTALAEGLALNRATPELRRTLQLFQLTTDPADPGIAATYMQERDLVYGTGEKVETHALVVTTIGDMGVPAGTGVALGRNIGLVDFKNVDERYGKTPNQVLIDTYTIEGVDTLKRYVDDTGRGVLFDVDNLALADEFGNVDGRKAKRLDPPLRLVGDDPLGGKSGHILCMYRDTGEHGIPLPGEDTDKLLQRCKDTCGTDVTDDTPDPCECEGQSYWDLGSYIINLAGRYGSSGAQWLDLDARCLASNDCDFLPEPPALRE